MIRAESRIMASNNNGPSDPFTKFWSDWMSQMGAMGMQQPAAPARDQAMKQMRQAFFDAWAQHCDEFMRSEMFLDAMKRSMDSALAFKQQMNEFFTKALHEGQAPARTDTDSIMLVLRSFEERVLNRIDDLAQRVTNLEAHVGRAATRQETDEEGKASAGAPRRAKGAAR